KGRRRVRVGYVIENPIWKTSYRLVLAKHDPKDKEAKEQKADRPYLQGWAGVENTTDEDWNGVRMALISGRPVSFRMNLYDALFIRRPVVEPELFASLRPPSYSGGLTEGDRLHRQHREEEAEEKKPQGKKGESKSGRRRVQEAARALEQDKAIKDLK